jgi:hypothetical protein
MQPRRPPPTVQLGHERLWPQMLVNVDSLRFAASL